MTVVHHRVINQGVRGETPPSCYTTAASICAISRGAQQSRSICKTKQLFPMLNGPCWLVFLSLKTDETDGMMDRPTENQTNTSLLQLWVSMAKRKQKRGLHPSYLFWWMDDWLHSPNMMAKPQQNMQMLAFFPKAPKQPLKDGQKKSKQLPPRVPRVFGHKVHTHKSGILFSESYLHNQC